MTFVDNTPALHCTPEQTHASPTEASELWRFRVANVLIRGGRWRGIPKLCHRASPRRAVTNLAGSCAARNWRCSTEQQQQPRCLQVLHCGDSLKQQLMFRRLQIRLIYDAERPTGKAILGQWQLKTTLPHHCARFHQARCSNELRNFGQLRPTPVPKLGLPVVLTTPLAKPSALPRLCVVNK